MAMVEAGSLIALAPLMQVVAEGADEYVGTLGPLELKFSIFELSSIAATLVLLTLILTIATSYASARIISSNQYRRRLELVDSFIDAEWEAQDAVHDGRLVTFSLDFVNQSAHGLRDLAAFAKNVAGLVVFVGSALLVSWVATMAIATVTGLVFLLQSPIRKRARIYSAGYSECNVEISEELSTLERTARELNAYGVGTAAAAHLRRVARRQRALRVRGDVIGALPSPLFRTAGLLVIVALIASTASARGMEIAALGVVILLLYRSLSYGQNLAGVHAKLIVLVPVLEQLDEEQSRYQNRKRPVDGLEIKTANSLRLREVSYTYPGSKTPALAASLDFAIGEIVGVVGPSGAGKSTLVDLLVGLRQPSSGVVEISDTSLTELSDKSRARLIALVPQAVSVIPASVSENVDFYRALDEKRIDDAVDTVGLRSLVSDLPEGMNTQIGTGSRSVSGGQVQRLGIARAIAGNPDFLIMDEPTSALDPGSEELVANLIGRHRGTVGVIVIAHRLSTLRHCDRVIVIEDGRVSGDDSLEDLRETSNYVQAAFELGSLDWKQPPPRRD